MTNSKKETTQFLPVNKREVKNLYHGKCDIILVTGDAYVDHPAFGAALIGRYLQSKGFKVGIIAQPHADRVDDFRRLGRPRLFFGVTSGNMDSMVNHYTTQGRRRSDDAFTPGGGAPWRPDRAVLAYSQRCKEAFSGVHVVIGGLEASLRRMAHYDAWSDKIRRSILADSKADYLVYGPGEKAAVSIARALDADKSPDDIPGTAVMARKPRNPPWNEIDAGTVNAGSGPDLEKFLKILSRHEGRVRLPSFEQVTADKSLFALSSRIIREVLHRMQSVVLVQEHGNRDVVINPPSPPLSTHELDALHELPFTHRPHPMYGKAKIPAFEMIRHSVVLMRGCAGGCTFCSISEHQGHAMTSRSQASVLREVQSIRDNDTSFTGTITDLGGPTANLYAMNCDSTAARASCRRLSCLHPDICGHFKTNHTPLRKLYRLVRNEKGIKHVFIASGIRHDVALKDRDYIRDIAVHHTGGHLKLAPEHIKDNVLSYMMKPSIKHFDAFSRLFDKFSSRAGMHQYILPYFIAAHPGTSDDDMIALALWLKRKGIHVDQSQIFMPTPGTMASAMFYTGLDPAHISEKGFKPVFVPRGGRKRRFHKALVRFHDPANHEFLIRELKHMGRSSLIGRASFCLIRPIEKPVSHNRRPGPRDRKKGTGMR